MQHTGNVLWRAQVYFCDYSKQAKFCLDVTFFHLKCSYSLLQRVPSHLNSTGFPTIQDHPTSQFHHGHGLSSCNTLQLSNDASVYYGDPKHSSSFAYWVNSLKFSDPKHKTCFLTCICLTPPLRVNTVLE